MTALGVLCCFALFVCLTLLASFFLPSHLSLKHVHVQYMYTFCDTVIVCSPSPLPPPLPPSYSPLPPHPLPLSLLFSPSPPPSLPPSLLFSPSPLPSSLLFSPSPSLLPPPPYCSAISVCMKEIARERKCFLLIVQLYTCTVHVYCLCYTALMGGGLKG